MDPWVELTREPIVQAALVFAGGLIIGYVIGRTTVRLLDWIGIPLVVEGTGTERWLQRMGTSTVRVIGRLVSVFIYLSGLLAALLILGVIHGDVFWELATAWMPHLFVAVFVLVIGVILADKIEILTKERLQGVKLPEVSVIPGIIKYSIIFIAVLIALGQIGVHTTALMILLTVYFFGLVLFGAIALRDFLSSGSAGIYLLLQEPITIGDEVTIGDASGIVQEVGVFVTHIEGDDREYIVPNRRILQDGIVRNRD